MGGKCGITHIRLARTWPVPGDDIYQPENIVNHIKGKLPKSEVVQNMFLVGLLVYVSDVEQSATRTMAS